MKVNDKRYFNSDQQYSWGITIIFIVTQNNHNYIEQSFLIVMQAQGAQIVQYGTTFLKVD